MVLFIHQFMAVCGVPPKAGLPTYTFSNAFEYAYDCASMRSYHLPPRVSVWRVKSTRLLQAISRL